jgi:hypothetical protein
MTSRRTSADGCLTVERIKSIKPSDTEIERNGVVRMPVGEFAQLCDRALLTLSKTVPDNALLRDALAYINHVGANHTMRGEPHPQQWLVDKLEAAVNAPRTEIAPPGILAAAEETISKGMSWIGGFICTGPEQEERKAGMVEECRATLASIRAIEACAPSSIADTKELESQRENLAILVRRLIIQVRHHDQDNGCAKAAMNYLCMKGLQGDPKRDVAALSHELPRSVVGAYNALSLAIATFYAKDERLLGYVTQLGEALKASPHNQLPINAAPQPAPAGEVDSGSRSADAAPSTEPRNEDRIAEDAIDLFLEYRDKHGHDEEAAKAAALNEFAEAASPEVRALEPTPSSIEPRVPDSEIAHMVKRLREPTFNTYVVVMGEAATMLEDMAASAPFAKRQTVKDHAIADKDVALYVHSLRAINTPWSHGCAELMKRIWQTSPSATPHRSSGVLPYSPMDTACIRPKP